MVTNSKISKCTSQQFISVLCSYLLTIQIYQSEISKKKFHSVTRLYQYYIEMASSIFYIYVISSVNFHHSQSYISLKNLKSR